MANDLGTMVRGDTLEFTATFTRGGLPVDLSNATIIVTAKLDEEDSDDDAIFQIGNSGALTGVVIDDNPLLGKAYMTVPPEATAYPVITEVSVLVLDIELTEANGRRSTPMKPTLTIDTDVTRHD
jgi:hypothetical protein